MFRKTGLLKSVKRFLNLHEYQASELLSHYNLPVLFGRHAETPTEAKIVADEIQQKTNLGFVLKAQVHSGGRGRGYFKNSGLQGGVKMLSTPEEVKAISSQMLNDILITKQSGEHGKPCHAVYVVEKVNIEKEMYLSIMLDRERACPLLIVSPEGGMGIEEIDKKFILQKQLDPIQGLTEKDIEEVVDFVNLKSEEQKEKMRDILDGLYQCFHEKDATLVEINPLGIIEDGRILICDSKLNIDDNAQPRLQELFKKEDLSQKDKKEVLAEKYDLNYVKLDGNIGCLVNGAGLAMATMDLINFKGGKPANFLDIGGGSDAEGVKNAISIIDDDQDVKSIMINIFGGIVRCDIVVEGIILAVKELGVKKPIIMRIKGNNSILAKKMVEDSGLNLYWCETVEEATEKALSF